MNTRSDMPVYTLSIIAAMVLAVVTFAVLNPPAIDPEIASIAYSSM